MTANRWHLLFLLISLLPGGVEGLRADRSFEQQVVPLLEKYCYDCHDDLTTKGNLDLTAFTDAKSVLMERKRWLRILHQIESREMPPRKPFPEEDELAALIKGVDRAVNDVDWSLFRNAGHVPLARLSKLQYRNSVRDLLGIDFHAGITLPQDMEGSSGFRNDRSSLLLSGGYLEKYYTEAHRALDALFHLDRSPKPAIRKIEARSFKVFRARIDKNRKPAALVLPTPSATGSAVVVLPETGYYRIRLRASTTKYPVTGLNVYADGDKIGDLVIAGENARSYTMERLMQKGANLISLRTDVGALSQRNDYSVEFPVPPGLRAEAKRIADAAAPRLKPLPHYSKAARDLLRDTNQKAYQIYEYYQLMKLLQENDAVSDDSRVRGEWLGRRTRYKQANMKLAVALKVSDEEVFQRWEKETDSPGFAEYMDFGNAYVDESRAKYFYKRPFSGEVSVGQIQFEGPIVPGEIETEGLFSRFPHPAEDREEWVTETLRWFATKAFRREVDDDLLARLRGFYSTSRKTGDDFHTALKDALAAVLCSPEFLCRFDAMHGSEAEVRLDSHQLAGRLASFLWSSVPDDELLGLAAHERFIPPAALATQLERMRRSPKIRAFAESFISEWLDYSGLGGNIMPNLGRYPEFSRALAGDMKLEVERFFEHLLREDRSLLELLDSKYLVVNERLANFYGHPQPQPGGDFSVLERHSDHLGGLLGMSALMTVTSTPTRTSPVKRGVWLLEKVLGERLPPAPANVPELPPGTGEEGGLSVRQELAKHREQKTCAACHDRIDDFGFVLENFDAIGRWRASVGGQPVDSTVRLGNGKTYAGVSEFKSYLIEERSHDFIRNLTEQMLSYALGRPLEYFDTPVVETISQRVIENGFRPSVMIGEIAKSYPFTWQRIQPQP